MQPNLYTTEVLLKVRADEAIRQAEKDRMIAVLTSRPERAERTSGRRTAMRGLALRLAGLVGA